MQKANRLLIIEDTPPVRTELVRLLSDMGYECEAPDTFLSVGKMALEGKYDLLILDLNLPHESGFQICMEIKKKSTMPVLILTSRDGDADEILSLELGADDYVTKPFKREILLARIKALLRRSVTIEDRIDCGYFFLYPMEYAISLREDSEKILLPRNECRILLTLVKKQGQAVSREDLMLALWQSDVFVDENTLTVNVGRLRQSLKTVCSQELVSTVRGVGYLLRSRDDARIKKAPSKAGGGDRA